MRGMNEKDTAIVSKAITDLLEEVHVGLPNPRMTWLVSNEQDSGFTGTLSGISAREASRPPAPGMNTIASHARHLHYALSLANRAMRGENPYDNADWPGSFQPQAADDAGWDQLRQGLRREHEQFLAAVRARKDWDDAILLQGVMAAVGHGAYHLGAVRQIIRMVRAGG
jgi:hypothetical protein